MANGPGSAPQSAEHGISPAAMRYASWIAGWMHNILPRPGRLLHGSHAPCGRRFQEDACLAISKRNMASLDAGYPPQSVRLGPSRERPGPRPQSARSCMACCCFVLVWSLEVQGIRKYMRKQARYLKVPIASRLACSKGKFPHKKRRSSLPPPNLASIAYIRTRLDICVEYRTLLSCKAAWARCGATRSAAAAPSQAKPTAP